MNAAIRIDIVWLFALGLAVLVAWCVAAGLWIGAAALIAATAVGLCAVQWPGLLPSIWLLGTPTVFVMIDNALAGTPLLTVERLLFLPIVILLAIRFAVKPDSFAKPTGVEKAMALWLGILLVSWIAHLSGKPGLERKEDAVLLLEAFVMPFMAFVIARNLNWDTKTTDRLIWWLVAGVGTYLVVVGLLQFAFHWNFFLDQRSPLEHPDRVTGPFVNALEYGTVMMIVLLLALYLLTRSTRRFTRFLLLVLMAGMTTGLVLCKGRAVWMSIPLALAIVFVRVPRLRRMLTMAGIGVALLFLLGPLLVDPSDLSRRLSSSEEYYNRMALWGTAGNMIAHAPIFGYGFGSRTFLHYKTQFYHSFNGVSSVWASWPSVPHNELLHCWVLAGIFGLGGCLLLWGTVWRCLGRAGAPGSAAAGRELAPFVQAGFLVVLVNAMFLDMMFLSYVPLLIYFLSGLALRPGAEARA